MAPLILNPQVHNEIVRLSNVRQVDAKLLEEFAYFVVQNSKQQSSSTSTSLKISELKQAVYNRFNLQNNQDLRKSGSFKMATDGMEKLDFRLKSTWEILYRKFVGIIPG